MLIRYEIAANDFFFLTSDIKAAIFLQIVYGAPIAPHNLQTTSFRTNANLSYVLK